MKRLFVATIILIILSFQVSALSAVITKPLPQDEPVTINITQSINFESSVVGGIPPYFIDWTFCTGSDCTPVTSSVEDPGSVQFLKVGTYTVLLNATDSTNITPENDIDTYQVIVGMTYILEPTTESGRNFSDPIQFRGIAGGVSTNVDYSWNWGDGSPITFDLGVIPGTESTPTHIYSEPGIYYLNLTASDLAGNTDSDVITLFIIDPTPLQFNCTVRYLTCLPGEIELLRMFDITNSHAYGFDHPNASLYDYPICCNTSLIAYVTNNTPSNPGGVYATLQNDSESQISGGHKAGDGNIIVAHYFMGGILGEGLKCNTVINNSCEILNQECVYEFSDEGIPDGGSHFANCSDVYDNKQCCNIGEDCTNNLDDDNNTWADTGDNDFASGQLACGDGVLCGISKTKLLPECAWTENYCDAQGCDFRDMGNPVGYFPLILGVEGYIVSDYYTGCIYVYNVSDGIMLQPGQPASCAASPAFTTNWLADSDFQTAATNWGVTDFELYNRCKFYYCSTGVDGTLPAYVQDMQTNAYLTRHICKFDAYWDPVFQACRDYARCYDPANPSAYSCDKDYETNFTGWVTDALPTDPVPDEDCFDSLSGNNDRACCPVWVGGENTYDYVNVVYFIVP